ncbi:MAG: hypothetical protein CMH50_05170 [Myxococcales bacterium]|nr:hypothetical protein [Myxococcales bacterium]
MNRSVSCVLLLITAACVEDPVIPLEAVPAGGRSVRIAEGHDGKTIWDPKNGWWPRVAISQDGMVHVAWCNAHIGRVMYAQRQQDGEWKTETVDAAPGAGRYLAMTLDQEGHPLLTYQVQEKGLFRLTRRVENTWKMEVIKKADGIGRATQFAFDDRGGIHLVYYDVDRGFWHSHRDKVGLWSHHLIENTVQGNHLSRPAFHRFDDGRLLVYFADNRYTQTHMMRAERPKGGTDWTVKRVAEDYGPGYQIGFAGPADDPTRELLFTITGKQSLALAKAEQLDDEKVFLEKVSSMALRRDPKGRLVILGSGGRMDRSDLGQRLYLIRHDPRKGRLRHFRIGMPMGAMHLDHAVADDGTVWSVYTADQDGSLFVHQLPPFKE